MELNLPPDYKVKVEVAASSLLVVRVAPDLSIYWSTGNDPGVLKKITFKELRPLLIERLRANPKLITLVQIDREAKYNDMVDVMDELNLAKIDKFSLAPMTDADKKLIARAG
jgi:biopolymer transport protein ExbD